ncbi:UL132 [Papio ursinus cytomegalovirus]|uniref:UL132 n=1 Tax=Papiine betaherpesvirus 4 TaxID=2560624 RepID=A0A0F7GB63_9BETA|nr:UL132 [Papio ursinus cytomegalovirus]AKG51576.1 UL132 [Papiine betaherpesvirus 4]
MTTSTSTTVTTNSSASTNGTASSIATSTASTTNSTATTTSSTVNATTVATAAAAATSVPFPLGDFLGIVIYCASTVALLCLLVVLVAALYGAFHSRHAANSYLGTKEEAAKLLKSERMSTKKRNRYENEYQPLRQSHSDTESMTDEDPAENHVMYFDKKGDLISLVNPNYGRPSSIMIDCQPDDDENIHYYMSIYKELATQAMTEPSDSWVLPASNVMQVSTQEVTLKEPECDDN